MRQHRRDVHRGGTKYQQAHGLAPSAGWLEYMSPPLQAHHHQPKKGYRRILTEWGLQAPLQGSGYCSRIPTCHWHTSCTSAAPHHFAMVWQLQAARTGNTLVGSRSLQPLRRQKKEDPGARKGRKVAKHCVFPMICGSGGSNSRLAKAVGAEQSGQMRD